MTDSRFIHITTNDPISSLLLAEYFHWLLKKKSWALKNWCFELWCWKRLLRVLWTAKETKSVNLKGNQSQIFTVRTDAEAETPVLWPHYVKNWLIGKDPDAGNDRMQEEKGTMKDGMVVLHHWLNGHEFEQTLGVGNGQGSLTCWSPWSYKESTRLNDWTEK